MDSTNYTFKEICDKTGYRSSVIRYYEKEFELNIPRDVNGRRIFTSKEFETLMLMKKLQGEGYSNKQIKRIMKEGLFNGNLESAASNEMLQGNLISPPSAKTEEEIIKFIDEKFKEISSTINEINSNIGTKERDILLTENLKLKMDLKQKSYEVMELKEKLRYEKEKKKGIFKNIFKKTK